MLPPTKISKVLTPAAEQVRLRAGNIALQLRHDYLGPTHLLLALLETVEEFRQYVPADARNHLLLCQQTGSQPYVIGRLPPLPTLLRIYTRAMQLSETENAGPGPQVTPLHLLEAVIEIVDESFSPLLVEWMQEHGVTKTGILAHLRGKEEPSAGGLHQADPQSAAALPPQVPTEPFAMGVFTGECLKQLREAAQILHLHEEFHEWLSRVVVPHLPMHLIDSIREEGGTLVTYSIMARADIEKKFGIKVGS